MKGTSHIKEKNMRARVGDVKQKPRESTSGVENSLMALDRPWRKQGIVADRDSMVNGPELWKDIRETLENHEMQWLME